MSRDILRFCRGCLMIGALFLGGIELALATNAPIISGSYDVVRSKALGAQVQVRMRIHLMNRGPSEFSIQRMTLWDFSHPDKGGSRACALTLPAHAFADTTQDFLVSRSDYQHWKKGFRPRFVLEMAGPRNAAGKPTARSTVVVRLDRISGQEGN